MKKILPFLILLSACSSQPNFRKSAAEENVKMEEDYSWVDQLNFDKKTETKYDANKDEFAIVASEADHSLIRESLVNIPAAKLEEALLKEKDDLTIMNIKCYQGKFEEALKIADTIYGQFKNNTSYWNQLGTCHNLKADYAKAILFYNKSRDLDPNFVPPVNNLGVVYEKQGKYQKALAAFKKAADMSTFSATPNYNLAALYLHFGLVGKALPIFQGLQKKSPQDIEVNSALAAAHIMLGDFTSALSLYSALDKAILAKAGVGLNYAIALKLANRQADAESALGSISPASSSEMKDYAQKVEKFIRN